MCGINGIVGLNGINDIEKRISKMNDSIKHRGPDACGYKIVNGNLAFGHRRLSIIDLDTRANQPMVSNCGNILVYNGEIYNYKEIKSKITNYEFKTQSDTEVILAGIEVYGIEWLLHEANGMFAFAYYDVNKEKIIIARDRLGIKPCYYYNDGVFVFSSEIKGILSSGLVEAKFNENAIDEYLANRYVRAPYTFFKGIYQLEAGTYIEVDVRSMNSSKHTFWNIPDEFNMDDEYNESILQEEFEKKVIDAINKRMVADVVVGTYLSGGVDSSLISSIASLQSKDKINTYTIGFPELNEFEYARKVAKKYNTNHHEIVIDTDDFFKNMLEVIKYKDAPLGVPNEIPLAIMSKKLKEKITVVLSGEGADELMGGYGRIFRSPYDYENLEYNKKVDFYDYFINMYEYVPRNIRDKYLNVTHELRDSMDQKIRKDFNEHRNEENVFRFFHKYHVKGLLQRVDTTTMLASVEARVPFLDHELVEYTYEKIPYELKLKWISSNKSGNKIDSANVYSEILDTPKYLLREVAKKYLPADVITRKKMGFPVPLNAWIKSLNNQAKTMLKDAYWLRTDLLDDLLIECEKESRAGQIIWMFINIELFRKTYFDREWIY